MTSLFRLVFLSVVICRFSFPVYSQSLTLQSFGSPSVTDVLQSSNVNASARGVVLDVHEASGISVYVWTEPDDVGSPSGNHNIYCALYDKNMIQMQTSFLVNLNTSGDQVQPAVKINQSDNTFIIVWISNHGTDGQYDIYAKKIDLYSQNFSLVAATTDHVINTDYTYLRQQTPKLTYDYAFDEVIIAWRDGDGQDGDGAGVYARRVSNTNFPSFPDSQFLVNQTITDNQVLYDMEVSPVTGALYVLYLSMSATTNNDVYTRRYNRNTDGTYTASSETMRNTTTANSQWNPSFKFNKTSGAYCIDWNSDYQDGDGRGIYFKVFDSTDAALTGEVRGSIPTANAQFTLHTAWDEESGYLMQFYMYNNGQVTVKYQLFDSTFATVGTETDALGGLNVIYSDAYYSIAYSQQSKNVYLNYIVFSGGDIGKTYARYFKYSNPTYAPPTCGTDNTRDWVSQAVYNEFGVKVKEQRTYMDQLGRTLQVQSRDFENKNTLAVATLYDAQGLPAIKTLPAPTNNQCLGYKSDFVTYQVFSTYVNYNYRLFDGTSLNLPTPIANNTGLGLYYSSANMAEPYVAASTFPYYRAYSNSVVTGGVNKSTSPGEDLKMGSGKEVKSFTAPILNELNHYIGLRNSYFVTSGSPLSTLAYQGTKTISLDENGVESVVFQDKSGNTLAKAILDGTVYTPLTATISPATFYAYNYTNSTGASVSMYISNALQLLEAYDFTSSTVLTAPTLFDPVIVLNGHQVQVRSKGSFSVNLLLSTGTTTVYPSKFEDPSHPSALDFYINSSTTLSLTGDTGASIVIMNAEKGTTVYSGLVSAFTSLSTNGFYRIRLVTPSFSTSYSSTALTVSYSINYSNFSYYFYDNAGRKVAEVAPNSLIAVSPNGINSVATTSPTYKTLYGYNSLGWTILKNDLDEGITNFVYRKDGSLRFKQNAQQATIGNFSYTNYDVAGRTAETGEYDLSHGAVVFQTHQNFVTSPNPVSVLYQLESTAVGGGLGTSCSCRTQTTTLSYNIASTSLPVYPSIPVNRTPTFLSGRISMTSNDNNTTWYSYDELGRTAWTIQNIVGLGYKTTDYRYDLNGNTLNVIYQDQTSPSERFEHRYTYDKNQRLKLVETRAGNGGAYLAQEKSYYYLNGALKRKELAVNLQGIDYVYTIQGWLKSINSPNLDASDPGGDKQTGVHSGFATDVFGLLLEYYNPTGTYQLGEYAQYGSKCSQALNNAQITTTGVTDKYNGTIKAMRWQTRGEPTGTPALSEYAFEYDKKYQLKTATFGSVATSVTNCSTGTGWYYQFTANTNYLVNNITYDANGNLLTKYTNDDAGSSSDPFAYNYNSSNMNRLLSVQTGASTYYVQQYLYNNIGQMVSQKLGSGLKDTIEYNAYGLTSRVSENSTGTKKVQAEFYYDEAGHRVKKKSYSTAGVLLYTTYYVNDAKGNVLSIYDDNGTSLSQKELPMYGISRIGVVYKATTYSYQYEICDHLGNVRVVIDGVKVSGEANILNWKDFYPHGAVMPGRGGSGSQRHDYQGQYAEKDGETGFNAFELRMYDARLGRWLSTDPMGQYWSPYIGMGNNPVNGGDPTGGEDPGDEGEGGARPPGYIGNGSVGGDTGPAGPENTSYGISYSGYNNSISISSGSMSNYTSASSSSDPNDINYVKNGVIISAIDTPGDGADQDPIGCCGGLLDVIPGWLESGYTVQNLQQGNYLDAAVWGTNAVIQVFLLGYGTVYARGASAAGEVALGSAAKGGFNAASKTLPELRAIAKQNSSAFRQLFGTGKEGAQSVLNNINNVKAPQGLSKEAMQAYRELINRVPDPTGAQAIRAQILDHFLK